MAFSAPTLPSEGVGVTIPFDDPRLAACALERGYAVATRNLRLGRLA